MTVSDIFDYELSSIKDDNIRKATEFMLQHLPSYFWKVPSSSTGRYHPVFSNGDGGLVRHIKAAVTIFNDLKVLKLFSLTAEEQDLALMALILHDGTKYGETTQSQYTLKSHPKVMAEYLDKFRSDLLKYLTESQYQIVRSAVESHSGQWTEYDDYPNEPHEGNLPEPQSKLEYLVHLSDFLSSRVYLNIDFSRRVIR